MNRRLWTISVAFVAVVAFAQEKLRYFGDSISAEEQNAIERTLILRGELPFDADVLVTRHDIDSDGKTDLFVTMLGQRPRIGVLLERGRSFESHLGVCQEDIKKGEPIEVAFADGQRAPLKDVIIRTPRHCALIEIQKERRIEGKEGSLSLQCERFDCEKSNDAYVQQRADCIKAGGKWRSSSHVYRYAGCAMPVVPTRDAGKPCANANECEVGCIYVNPPVQPGAPVTGRCAASKLSTCLTFIDKGKIAGGSPCP